MTNRMVGPSRAGSWRNPVLVVVGLVTLFVIGCATGRGQPHMAAARDHLEAAHGELQVAVSDKGGHRTRAIELVDRAISEVQAGIDYAAAHR
jgi:hypothetical protein